MFYATNSPSPLDAPSVRLRANKIKPCVLILLGLSVLHLFSYPLKMSCKKTFVF